MDYESAESRFVPATRMDLDPAAEQGVDKVLIGMADLVPVARIPPGGACRQIELPVDLAQIHQKNAGIDVFRDTGAYQPQAERLGREGSFGLSGGIVQRSGQKE